METKVNVLSESEHELEVTLDYDEIKNEIEEAYKKERKSISLPGFRKGKVPIPMLKKIYGEMIEYKASEDIANKKFWEIVDAQKLEPISTPQLSDLDFEIGKQLKFKVKYDVKPKLDLKDYTGLEIEKPVFKVKEEDIENEIKNILKAHSKFEEAEIIEDENYRVVLDLIRKDENNKDIDDTKSEDVTVDLSDPKVNPEIAKNATGKKVGDKFTFSFTDEHKHGDEVHKEEYNYEATIKKIEKIIPPEITEEFVQKISNNKAKTLDEFREQLRKEFKDYLEKQSEDIFLNALLNKVVENNDFKVPRGYVELLEKRMLQSELDNAKAYGYKNVDEQKILEQIKPRAEWNAKWQVILANIAEKENLKVTDEELRELSKEEAEKTGISEDKLFKYYKDSNKAELMLEEKVIDFLKKNNTAKEYDPAEKAKEKEKETDKKETTK